MKAHLIFQTISPATAENILGYFQNEEREAYRAAVGTLAGKRRLRPQFILKKTRADQAAWLAQQVRSPGTEEIALQLIQVWLFKGRTEMLKTFLDQQDIAHDGEGSVEDLPDTLDDEKLKKSIDALLEKWPGEEVAIYLILFNQQRTDGWDNLAKIIETDERLKMG